MGRSHFAALLLVWQLLPHGASRPAYAADAPVDHRSTRPAQQDAGPLAALDADEAAERIVPFTDEFRRQGNRGSVRVNAQLREAARYFARYIADSGRLSHEADGNTPAVRARKYGYDYCIIAENLAYEYSSSGFAADDLARKMIEGWKNSPEHRKNMLEPDLIEIGVAIAASSTKPGAYYGVQMFGRPKSAAIHFQITNRSNAAVRYQVAGKPWTLSPRETRTHDGCALGELRVDLPGKPVTVEISDGDRYALVQSGSRTVTLMRQ